MTDFEFYHQLIDNYDKEKYNLLKAQTFDPNHFGFPPIYYKIMETDTKRVGAFVAAFEKHNNLKDAVVCEAGIGNLALTRHFLPYVKKAYLIENNPDLKDYIIDEIERLGFADKVVLIFDDALKVELPEPVDFVIAEMMSIFCANEFQVQVFQHLRQFLKPKGKLIPEKIVNTVQLCNADFEGDFKHYPINFSRHLPEEMSLPEEVNTINLYKEENLTIQKEIDIQPLLTGTANAVFLRSYVRLSEGINFTGTDSLMPPTVLKIDESKIEANKLIKLHTGYSYGTSLDEAIFSLEEKV